MEINIVFLIVVCLIMGGAIKGYKRGLIREISSFTGLVMALAAIIAVIAAVGGYRSENTMQMIVAVVCFVIIVLAHKILDFILESLKLITKLPLVGGVNKIAGIIAGAAEGVIVIWITFLLMVSFNILGLGAYLMISVQNNQLLSLLFYNNFIAEIINRVQI